MYRTAYVPCLLVLALSALSGCGGSSDKPAAKAAPLDKIEGKALVADWETTAGDTALNAGGPSVYLIDGLHRYRLFFNKSVPVDNGKIYVAEGVYAQKAIDTIGDPDNGKNGYPLAASCDRVIHTAWPGLAFDLADAHSTVLRTRVKRYPARPVFLVTHLTPAAESAKAEAEEEDLPEIDVPADKQRASLIEGPAALAAPLWEPTGGSVNCKVVIGRDGKIAELGTGTQLCEMVPWTQYRFQPPMKAGKPVKVKTEVAVLFNPLK